MSRSIYLDSSVLMSIILQEPDGPLVAGRIRTSPAPCLISDFAVLEFHDAVARRARTSPKLALLADSLLIALDAWSSHHANRVEMDGGDIADAIALVRIAKPHLRAQDAIHLAAARRLDSRIYTLDDGMREAALRLNLQVL
jgi:uncharacterized protein